MLSYHADADINTNPYELGLDRLVNLDIEAEFIGKAALRRIRGEGPRRKQIGLIIDAAPLKGPNTTFWAINVAGAQVGKVTSAVYSPRLERNIALAMVAAEHAPEITRDAPQFTLKSRKAIGPDDEELAVNPRARSARLRVATRTDAPAGRSERSALGVPMLKGAK